MEPFHLIVALLILADFTWGAQHKQPEPIREVSSEESTSQPDNNL